VTAFVWFAEVEVSAVMWYTGREPHDHGWAYLVDLWSTSDGRPMMGLEI
jgi:hypothetical protein